MNPHLTALSQHGFNPRDLPSGPRRRLSRCVTGCRRRTVLLATVIAAIALCGSVAGAGAAEHAAFNPRDFGARGDGQAKDTAAVQAAIDATAKAGGGAVRLTAGRYLCGTLHLRSHLTIRLESGAVLAESQDAADFEPREVRLNELQTDSKTVDFHCALLAGDGVEDVAIEGHGVLDGNRTSRKKRSPGPKPIALKNCRHVTVCDVHIINSPSYALSLLGCEHVDIDGVTIFNSYEDGIDPDSCRYLRIANCDIDARDDAIVLKSSCVLDPPQPTEFVTITNCVLSTDCNFFKMGTESSGAFRHIAFSNCVMIPRTEAMRTTPNIAGLAIETVDGADIDGVVISNVEMHEVTCPIFMRLGARGRGQPTPKPGVLRNVSISNIMAIDSRIQSAIAGIPGRPIEGVTLSDIRVTVPSIPLLRSDLQVPEKAAGYPDAGMFGPLPCTGLYLRHVTGVTVRDFQITCANGNPRTLLVADDVNGLDLDGFQVLGTPGAGPIFWLNDARGATIRSVRAGSALASDLLRTTGACQNVHIQPL